MCRNVPRCIATVTTNLVPTASSTAMEAMLWWGKEKWHVVSYCDVGYCHQCGEIWMRNLRLRQELSSCWSWHSKLLIFCLVFGFIAWDRASQQAYLCKVISIKCLLSKRNIVYYSDSANDYQVLVAILSWLVASAIVLPVKQPARNLGGSKAVLPATRFQKSI